MSKQPASIVAAPQALTRRKTGRTPRRMFLPCVLDWINDESPAKLGYKSRRTGWTYGESYDAISRRERPQNPRDQDYWFSSADESAGLEFIEYCRFWKEDLFGGVADYFVEQIEDPQSRRVATAHVIRCSNKSRITAMTSNPRRFRSKGGDVCLDEFGHHDEPGEMFDAAQPVTLWGGGLRVFGTPNGEEAELHKLARNCEKVLRALGIDPHATTHAAIPFETLAAKADELRISPVFSYHRVTITQAVQQGLVELLNATKGTQWTPEAFLAHLRRSSRNVSAYLQEYECTPSMNLLAALKYAVIEAAMHDDCPAPDQPLKGYTGGPCYIGMDVGRTHDLSVIWVWEAVGDVLWTRQIKRLRQTSMPDQESELAAIIRLVKAARVTILKRGIGVGIFDHMERRFGPLISGLDETLPNKVGMVTGCIQAFEDRRVRICDDATVKEALHSVREERTPGGQVTYVAPRSESGHADDFFAAAAGIDGASAPRDVFKSAPDVSVKKHQLRARGL